MKKDSKENANDWEKEKLNPDEKSTLQDTPNQEFNVVRRVYQQDSLNRDAEYHYVKKPLKYQAKKCVRDCGFGDCIKGALPIVKWLPKYKIGEYLMGDSIAGATTAIMHIPQGMAYAMLAEVQPIVGLYMAFFPVLVYAVLGTSPHVSIGTFAVACLMAGKVVTKITAPPANMTNITLLLEEIHGVEPMYVSPYTPGQVLAVVCITVGLFQVIMWVFRLGAVSTLLSEPLVSGFTTAAAFHVVASQLKDLLGIHIPKFSGNFKIVNTIAAVISKIPTVNLAALTISCIACIALTINNELLKPWVSKRSRVPVPIELIAIVTGTLVARYCKLKEIFGISLVGSIPTGLPIPQAPSVELIPMVALDCITITMVTYTISMSMALIFASRDKYEIDGNQELLALGASNIFGSFFCCAPICASLSRSYIQYQAGSKTAITSVISATLILFVLLWIGPFFEDLPKCVLASIIVVSLKGMMMQVKELRKFWKLSQLDALVWIITFFVTLLINIDFGLAAGLLASVAALFCRSQKPYTCLLGRVLNTDLYLDIKRYRAAEEIPGVKIFHYCGGLNFATKHLFRQTLFRKTGYMTPETPPQHDEDNNLTTPAFVWDPTIHRKVQCVIIDATALSYVDAQGIETLVAVHKELQTNNITVLFAGANAPILEMIHRYNKWETDAFHVETFPTVHDAVVYYNIIQAQSNNKNLNIAIET